MKYTFIFILIALFKIQSVAQTVIDPKGTKIQLDSSKWKTSGNDIYNKNIGKIGIGTASPSAQLHTTGDVRLEGIGTNTTNTKILTADTLGNITTRLASDLLTGNTGRKVITLTSDFATSSLNFVDIPDLSFNVTAGVTYRFYAMIPYVSSNQTNGSLWSINGPATSLLSYSSRNANSNNSDFVFYANSYDYIGPSNNNSSNSSGNLAVIQGIIKPTASGTVRIRFASELASPQSITAKAGASLEYW